MIHIMLLLALAGVVCLAVLLHALHTQPLSRPRPDDVEWLRTWLIATVTDYYGAALALSAVAYAEQPSHFRATLWTLAFVAFGSPACLAYVAVGRPE